MASVIQKMMPLLATSFLLLSAASETVVAANNNSRGQRINKNSTSKKDTTVGSGNLRASTVVKPLGSLQFYYPDITLKGCRKSSNEHLTTWLEQNSDNGYLFHDLEACCSTRFGEDVNGCLEASRGVHDTKEDGGKVGTAVNVINSDASAFQIIDSTSRRLAKSGKSNKSGKQGKYYKPSNPWKNNPPSKPKPKPKQKGPRPPQPQKPRPAWQKPPQQKKPHYHNHGPHWHSSTSDSKSGKSAKSGKSSKTKSSKAKYHYHPVKPKPRTRNPTRKPTPMPVGSKLVEITMGGLMTAHALNVPPPGSQELGDLAEAFEKTLMAVLDDDYHCDVTNIGGIPVVDGTNLGSSSSDGVDGVGMFTRSLQSSDVLFHCKVIKPCPGDCTSTQAIMLASRVFDETFEELGEKAESGELAVIFCIFAEVANLVAEPCGVTITSVEGTSLDVNYVDGPSTPKPTKKPSPMPTLPKIPGTPAPTPKPTLLPVKVTPPPNRWPPTPMPTDDPVVGTTSPTTYGPTPTSSGTFEPTTPPPVSVDSPTMSPVLTTTTTTGATSTGTTTTGATTTGGTPPTPTYEPTPTTSGTFDPTTQAPVGVDLPTPSPVLMTTTTTGTTTSSAATTTTTTTSATSTTSAGSTSSPTLSPNMKPTGSPVPVPGSKSPTSSPILGSTTPTAPPIDRGLTASPTTTPTDPPVPVSSSKSPTLSPALPEIPVTPSGSPVGQDGSVVPTPLTSYPTLMPTRIPTGEGTTVAPTSIPKSPTNAPVSSSTPPPDGGSTISPTSIPPGATFYDGFETGSFGFPGSDAEWLTEGDGLWRHTTEKAASGRYSVRSPELDNPDLIPLSSNLTLALGESYGPGTLVFSIQSSVDMPFDNLVCFVDGEMRDQFMGMTSFEAKQLVLSPGAHTIIFQYVYNPIGLEFFPPENPDRSRAAFIDDVYFLPAGETIEPTSPPVSGPMTTSPVPGPEGSDSPTPATVPSAPSTISPTPQGALYFDGFEEGTFPDSSEWSTTGDGLWELSTDLVNTGRYSIRTPDLSNADFTPGFSNVTLSTNPAWMGGTVVLSILAGVSMPYDGVIIYVDDVTRGQLSDKTKFEQLKIEVGPGPHKITFAYAHNPQDLDALPPKPEGVEHVGAVFIDDVYFLPSGVTVAPTEVNTPSPTVSVSPTINQDTAAPSPTMTISPTSTPEGALYYDSFEQGTFPDDPEWSISSDDGDWILTKERSTSGVFSIRTPDFFDLEDTTKKVANATLSTNPQWPAGTLHFSLLSGLDIPYDNLIFYIDGEMRGQANEMTEFESRFFQLSPGPHQIVYSYQWNPMEVDAFPPTPNGRIGAAFIDDVYFVPEGVETTPPAPTSPVPTSNPTPSPVPLERSVSPTGRPVETVGSESPTYYPSYNPTVGGETTTSPTSIPAGALYYDGFEQATFPDDPEWSTSGDSEWLLTTESTHSGTYSIRSPDLSFLQSGTSNVVLSLGDPDFEGGSFIASILAGIELPIDSFAYYLDDALVNEMATQLEWETVEIPLGPGPHEVRFEFKRNPFELDGLPPASATHLGVVYIDDVHVLPFSDNFFDGFESGDFESGLDWVTSGEDAWVVDDTNAFEGTYSAHARTVDISSGNFTQLDLEITAASAAFVQFYFYAPVAMPFEKFDLLIDDQFLTGLSTVDETWAQAGAIISAGEHLVSWRLSNNPGGAPVGLLDTVTPPDYRLGEAWLDNVQLLPSTPSFVETWASGDFTAHPWILTGDADWSITDSSAYVGTNSAAISSDDITESTGFSHLSMDIITEQGGMLKFKIRPLVEGPFEISHVLIDDIKVFEYLSVPDSPETWLDQELTIQPGKRRVTFELIKNPGNIPDMVISTLPPIQGREGRVYLDEIVFEANVEAMS